MIRYVLIEAFCNFSGYTDKAVRRKIASGVWLEGRVWKKAPDGHIMIDLEGYCRWVEKNGESSPAVDPSDSASTGEVVGVVKLFPLNRTKQISPTPADSAPKSSAK